MPAAAGNAANITGFGKDAGLGRLASTAIARLSAAAGGSRLGIQLFRKQFINCKHF
jgi:hypothetical protein